MGIGNKWIELIFYLSRMGMDYASNYPFLAIIFLSQYGIFCGSQSPKSP